MPLSVPVRVTVQSGTASTPRLTAEIGLTPLTVGDYLIEVRRGAAPEGRVLTAFRVER